MRLLELVTVTVCLLAVLHRAQCGPVVTCGEQSHCLTYTETCLQNGMVRACIMWDSTKPGCNKDGPISHVCLENGRKVEDWSQGTEFCADDTTPGSMVTFGVKDGRPRRTTTNDGGSYPIVGNPIDAECATDLGNYCNPTQTSQTEAEWTFTTGSCGGGGGGGESGPVVFCQQQASCLKYTEQCLAPDRITACITWDSTLTGCIKAPPTISHVCDTNGNKVDDWNENTPFCITGSPNTQITFAVKDGNPSSQGSASNTGGGYVIEGYTGAFGNPIDAECATVLGNYCIPTQTTQTEAEWTFTTGSCSAAP